MWPEPSSSGDTARRAGAAVPSFLRGAAAAAAGGPGGAGVGSRITGAARGRACARGQKGPRSAGADGRPFAGVPSGG